MKQELDRVKEVLTSEEYQKAYTKEMRRLIRYVESYRKVHDEDISHAEINSICMRVKSYESTIDKLERKRRAITLDNTFQTINDLAGIRIVCLFLDDVYEISQYIASLECVNILKVKDFIKKPKQSGYQSLHLIVEVSGKSYLDYPMKIEIQIRTVAMNFWSVLEYQLQYKKKNKEMKSLQDQLKQLAGSIALMDQEVQEIRRRIDGMKADA